jgi:hypothetical protein
MEKRLCVVGNSLAVVIDKPLRKRLGLSRNTVVRLWSDGRRIVIEPTGETRTKGPTRDTPLAGPGPVSAEQLDARRVVTTLMHRYGMWDEQLQRLYHVEPRRRLCLSLYENPDEVAKATPEEIQTMRRLAECLRQRQANRSWDEAIEAALAAFPKGESSSG